jgi:hypothetical protein
MIFHLMKTFNQFLEQAGSPSMSARQEMQKNLSFERSKQAIKQGFWRQRQSIRRKTSQDAEMHSDLERRHSLP